MKALLSSAALGLLLLVPSAATAAPYVVVLRDDVADASRAVDKVAARAGATPGLTYGAALRGFAADLSPGQLTLLRRDPDVAFVEPDVIVKASGLGGSVASGETVPPGIARVGGVTGGRVHLPAGPVAVVDSGIDLANADLVARSGINCVKTGTAPADDFGHGTNVAGVIGARNAGTGAVGVTPGTPVYAVKVLGKTGTGTLSQILCGINWVTANASALGIRVANMSVEGTGADDGACGAVNSDSWHKAICSSVAAGVTWVVSAGNAATGLERTIPAAYREVLTVTAMSDTDGVPGAKGAVPACKRGEADDRYASFSNYATTTLSAAHTIAAPGTCIASTKVGGGLSTYYGTSQAAPHVAAAAAACIGTPAAPGPCAGLTPAGVASRLRSDADATSLTSGFTGDPLKPITGRIYGSLVTAAAY